MEMSHSWTPPIHTHFPSQSTCNLTGLSTHTYVQTNATPSAVSEVSLAVEPSYSVQPSLTGIYCREESEWPSCEANCSLQREREREREREKGEVEERKRCVGAQVAPRDLRCAMIGYRHTGKDVVREGGEAVGLTCSGVSSITAQTQP